MDTFKVPSPDSMMCLASFRFNPNYVDTFITNIILYQPLAESSTWKSHITIFVPLNSGKSKSILTLRLVVGLTDFVFHCITASYLVLSVITLIITIVELHVPSNNIKNFLTVAFPFHVFTVIETQFIYITQIFFIDFAIGVIILLWFTFALNFVFIYSCRMILTISFWTIAFTS